MLQLQAPSREHVVSLLSNLVGIDSINPSLVPGATGETRIAEFVATWLRKRGLFVEVTEVAPGRPNVIATLQRGPGRSLLLNAHMDTVGVAGMEKPFQVHVDGDKLYGRGAYDMKGGLASIMLAAEMVAHSGFEGGDLIITAVADEEYASLGTEAVVQAIRADAAVVTEPTGLRLCIAHKGFAWISIETIGKAAHGSKPSLGIDAIAHMGRVLTSIEQIGVQLAGGLPHPLLGTGSIHASLIDGGQEISSYPERCRLQIERRTVPGESRELVDKEIQSLLARLARDSPSFSGKADLFFWRDAFEVGQDEAVFQAMERAALEVLGSPPAVYGDTPWMDAALLSAAGIPTVVFGPGGAGAHAATEYVSVGDVARCAQILAQCAVNFCSAC